MRQKSSSSVAITGKPPAAKVVMARVRKGLDLCGEFEGWLVTLVLRGGEGSERLLEGIAEG